MTDTPTFVVVGNVNQGKSSVVAALAENERVPIDSYPGTTARSGAYAFSMHDQELFKIVDTPGFQEPRRALAWMRERASHPGERAQAVRQFVEHFANTEEFTDEVELLRPILDGAGILYVVDASARFQPSNEAEMEILRWTGEPGMALVNRTLARDYSDEWRPVLEQFFNVVRSFDAHHATFEDRLRLLRGFAEIRESWRGAVQAAVDTMQDHWRERLDDAADIIAAFLVRSLSHFESERTVPDDETQQARLTEQYRGSLRSMEADARLAIEQLFNHDRLNRNESAFELVDEDLFSEQSFRAFGLSRTQLATGGAASGAVAGAGVDLMVGGASMLLGAALGSAAGAALGYLGLEKISETWDSRSKLARALLPDLGGQYIGVGPVKSAAFAWVLVDRALVHLQAVTERSHAQRGALEEPKADGSVTTQLERGERATLDKCLRRILSNAAKRQDQTSEQDQLQGEIRELLGTFSIE